MQKFHSSRILLCLLLFAFPVAGSGDEIKLKSGETLEGRITYEADDIVKIELTISASIKETKIIARGDIAEIIKETPDNVAFREMQDLLPVASLTPAGTYKTLIESGPASFLRNFPDSVHTEKVKEIKAQLDEELDKVERGFIKLEEEWLSPQDQAEFETLISSRIEFLRMNAAVRSGNHNGIITALRHFEVIESKFYGTPAFAKGVELALEAIPALGRQLQGMLRDVEYRNAEYERNKSALDEIARAQVEAARKREEDNYQAGLAADKKEGIKWVRLNSRSKPSIEAYLKLAAAELTRIREYDPAQLKLQSEKLVEVDQLIAKKNYELAKSKLDEAAAITGKTAGAKSSSKNKGKGASSYIAALSIKLNDKIAERTAQEEARQAAAESQALTANLNKKKDSPADGEKKEESVAPEVEGETETAPEPKAEETPSPEEMFAALSGKEKAAGNEKAKAGSPEKKAKADEETDKNGEDEREREPVVVDDGGGFPFSLIIPLITVLLLVTVVVLKYLGIGTKKSDDDDETPETDE